MSESLPLLVSRDSGELGFRRRWSDLSCRCRIVSGGWCRLGAVASYSFVFEDRDFTANGIRGLMSFAMTAFC